MVFVELGFSFYFMFNVIGLEGILLFICCVICVIDIFLLGLVYYYMLICGKYFYDCGDCFMCEVNICKGIKSFKDFSVLGDRIVEVEYLIDWMFNLDFKECFIVK